MNLMKSRILEHKDSKEKILWSKCYIKLYPSGQGPTLNLNIDMRYEVIAGEAVFWINGATTNVEAGHSFVVEANQTHFFHNYSNSVEFQFAFDYPDKLRMKVPTIILNPTKSQLTTKIHIR